MMRKGKEPGNGVSYCAKMWSIHRREMERFS
jgi:hypothetical protein